MTPRCYCCGAILTGDFVASILKGSCNTKVITLLSCPVCSAIFTEAIEVISNRDDCIHESKVYGPLREINDP